MISQNGLTFMTQNVHPDAHMEALFTGDVVADGEGCLRTAAPDEHVVVWPAGYTLDTSGTDAVVMDDAGSVVGTLGGAFSLAGGEVPVLLESMGFTDADRTRSEACPGPYWIVNDES